jgi:hypothetical protein
MPTELAKLVAALLPQFPYFCKKTGETTTIDVAEMPDNSIMYCVHKGLGEYFDNYHASETLKSTKSPSGKHATEAARAEAVKPLVAEALTRLMAGDMPRWGGRMVPVITDDAAEAHLAKKMGVTLEQFRAIMATAKAPESTLIKGKKAA